MVNRVLHLGASWHTVATTLDPLKKGTGTTLSGGNLTSSAGGADTSVLATVGATLASGAKRYCEARLNQKTNAQNFLGIATEDYVLDGAQFGLESGQDRSAGASTNTFWVNETNTAVSDTEATEYRGLAVDFTNMRAWIRTIISGTPGDWNNSATADPATNTEGIDISSLVSGTYYPGVCSRSSGDGWTVNFGATAYQASAPSGFTNWV